jgi:hypothetical protein
VQVDQLEFSTTGSHHEPAPGAWLWAPAGDTVLSDQDSAVFAMLLANRGPAIEAGDTPVDPESQHLQPYQRRSTQQPPGGEEQLRPFEGSTWRQSQRYRRPCAPHSRANPYESPRACGGCPYSMVVEVAIFGF